MRILNEASNPRQMQALENLRLALNKVCPKLFMSGEVKSLGLLSQGIVKGYEDEKSLYKDLSRVHRYLENSGYETDDFDRADRVLYSSDITDLDVLVRVVDSGFVVEVTERSEE